MQRVTRTQFSCADSMSAPAGRRLGRRAGRTGLVAICTVVAFAMASTAAVAKKPVAKKLSAASTLVTPGSGYLALGDSVTFGYKEAAVVPAPDYANAASFQGYPEQLGAELHLKVANAACPGETSSSLINTSAPSNGCENTPGGSGTAYRKAYPLHVRYRGSQLAYALSYLKSHKNTRLVSLMIGANDYFVCEETTADKCASASEQKAILGTIAKNIRTILSSVRNKAHYKGQLVIVNYYSLDYAAAATDALAMALDQTADAAARPFRVSIANGYTELQTASVDSGGNTCTAGLLTQLGTPGDCGIHPSYAGQALLAQSVAKAIRIS